MKSQKHNQGDLTEFKVLIETEVVKKIQGMVEKSGMTQDEIVVIALKRFISSHSDYLNKVPTYRG